jgi:hypothetical protein
MKYIKLFLIIGLLIAFLPVFAQDPVPAPTDTMAVIKAPAEVVPNPVPPIPTEFPKPLSFIFVVSIPFVLGYVKKWIASSKWRWILAIALSAAAGIACVLVSGIKLNWENIWVFPAVAFGYAQLAWGIFKYLIMNGDYKSTATKP